MMNKYVWIGAVTLTMGGSVYSQKEKEQDKPVSVWLTNPAQSIFFTRQPDLKPEKGNTGTDPVIRIEEDKRFQSIDGFGFALTGGSAQLIMKMSPEARTAFLQ